MSIHSFDTEIAARVGLNAAVLYQNIVFWAEHNMRNNRNYHEGRWWTFNSRRAFSEQFDYLTEKQIRVALDKLVKAGLIVKGEFNSKAYDRTNWYSPDVSVEWREPLDQKGQRLDQKGQGRAQKGQPIPDSKPDNKPDSPYRSADALDFPDFSGTLTSKQSRGQRDYDEARQRALRAAARGPREEAGEWF